MRYFANKNIQIYNLFLKNDFKSASVTTISQLNSRYLSTNKLRSSLFVGAKYKKNIKSFSIRSDKFFLENLSSRCFSQSAFLFNSDEILTKPNVFKSENVIDLTSETSSGNEILSQVFEPDGTLEISVASLKLASNYFPIGWCIHYLDFLHSILPWWSSIAIGTLIFRICLFPLVISAQKSASKLNELLPEQAILKEKMNQARISGDTVEFARLSTESFTLYKRKGVSPFKAMLAPLGQAPVFITFFLTLRRMANYPVESLKTGGIFWFTDLSIQDPYYALPIITSLTLWITLESSFRSGLNPNQTPLIKYGARVVPVVTLLFIFDFPAAILTYWCTNNIISLIQVFLLRQKSIRNFLNIPEIKVNPKKLDVNKKSFKQHFKETMDNAKINRIIEERKTIDEITFKKAGIGPLKKTFKHDPTRGQS